MRADLLDDLLEFVEGDGTDGPRRPRPPRPLIVAAIVLAAILALAGVVEVVRGGSDDDSGTDIRTAAPAAAPGNCHNSSDPACGPFRYDPQPGVDAPMTVQVAVEPALPQAGRPVVFHVTLHDPDGVSYGSSIYRFGESGIGDSSVKPCARFGTWDPPAPDPASATKVVDATYTYARPGTYTASFSFDAGPFDCVDASTGRGDRPYASSAQASVTVVVR